MATESQDSVSHCPGDRSSSWQSLVVIANVLTAWKNFAY